jgi:hypothetical protein
MAALGPMGPIGLAAAGALVAVSFALSKAHLAANEFVGKEAVNPLIQQNQFHKQLKDILDENNKLVSSGEQTADGAKRVREQVSKLWEDFVAGANEFAKKGKDEARVVEQAFASLNPLMEQVNSDLANQAKTILLDPMSGEFKDFRERLRPADALNEQLNKLMGAFSQKDVVAVYAQQILDVAKAQRKAGYEVTGTIADLEDAAKAFVNAKGSVVTGLPRVIPQTGLATSASQQFKATVDRLTSLIDAGSTGGQDVLNALDAILKWQLTPPTPVAKPKTPFELAVDIFSAAADLFSKGVNILFPTDTEGNVRPRSLFPAEAGGTTVEFNVSVSPVFHFNGVELDRLTIRQNVVPEIMDQLESNVFGVGERMVRFVSSRTQGITSSRPLPA